MITEDFYPGAWAAWKDALVTQVAADQKSTPAPPPEDPEDDPLPDIPGKTRSEVMAYASGLVFNQAYADLWQQVLIYHVDEQIVGRDQFTGLAASIYDQLVAGKSTAVISDMGRMGTLVSVM
jgi:hypothetical protein